MAQAEPEYLGIFEWQRPEPYFGGLSAIEIAEGGTDFLVIGDNAQTLRGRFERKEGLISAANVGWIGALRGSGGVPLFQAGDPDVMDSEGLAGGVDGPFYVSFEVLPRIWRYDSVDGPAIPLPLYRPLLHWAGNGAFEALAVDAAGTLYTIPEGRRSRLRAFPVYRFRDGVWSKPFAIKASDRYFPVGADFGPDGRLYLLERRHHGFLRFSSRVRRFRIDGDTLTEDTRILQSDPGQFDNLEGIAIWAEPGGALRMTLISDDNFLALQETQIVEFRLTD